MALKNLQKNVSPASIRAAPELTLSCDKSNIMEEIEVSRLPLTGILAKMQVSASLRLIIKTASCQKGRQGVIWSTSISQSTSDRQDLHTHCTLTDLFIWVRVKVCEYRFPSQKKPDNRTIVNSPLLRYENSKIDRGTVFRAVRVRVRFRLVCGMTEAETGPWRLISVRSGETTATTERRPSRPRGRRRLKALVQECFGFGCCSLDSVYQGRESWS